MGKGKRVHFVGGGESNFVLKFSKSRCNWGCIFIAVELPSRNQQGMNPLICLEAARTKSSLSEKDTNT